MVEIESDAPMFKKEFKARLEKKKALQFGPGTPRVARAAGRQQVRPLHRVRRPSLPCRRAPTGSLIEVNPYDLFREALAEDGAARATGYDDDLTDKDRREVLAGDAVHRGARGALGGLAKLKRGRYAPLLVWTVGIFAFLIALGEVPAPALRARDVVSVQ